jgi:hypothetical protein
MGSKKVQLLAFRFAQKIVSAVNVRLVFSEFARLEFEAFYEAIIVEQP